LLSFARRNDGEDIDENKCSNFELAEALRFSMYAATLLITENNAGYTAVSFPWLVVIIVKIEWIK
jgi:hypothetical protein